MLRASRPRSPLRIVSLWCTIALAGSCASTGSPYLEAAEDAARWITSPDATAQTRPATANQVSHNLYAGTAGVVLFFLEAHRATGTPRYLSEATARADTLLAAIPAERNSGLYDGLAGIGFALEEMHRHTGDKRFREGAARCVELVRERARAAGGGVEWNDANDIIRGTAGIGLFLLYAAREHSDDRARELAVRAGTRLIDAGRPAAGGLKWTRSAVYPTLQPNFSHGAAGVSYFLAALYSETKDRRFLEAALAGTGYLLAVADQSDGFKVFHHEPGGEDLFYMGWCHGPPGTARLFYKLHQVTGDSKWMDYVLRCADAVLASGIPERRTPGFCDNAGTCCGSAGVAEFFLDLYGITKDPRHLEFARRMTADVLARGTRSEGGLCWVHAEFRIRPEETLAQVGYLQGAAGIGAWLFRLDAFERGVESAVRFPDSPW